MGGGAPCFGSRPPVLTPSPPPAGPAEAAEEAAAAGRAWWLSDPAAGTFDAAAAGDAAGLEASLAAVAAAVAERGPFDGVLGFSQGAALGAMLCALGQRGHARFAPRFALLVAGFRSRAPAHARFYAEPLAVPSLHVVGQADAVIPPARSAELAACFVAPVVLEHPGGHFVPAAAPQREAYRRFLQRFLP